MNENVHGKRRSNNNDADEKIQEKKDECGIGWIACRLPPLRHGYNCAHLVAGGRIHSRKKKRNMNEYILGQKRKNKTSERVEKSTDWSRHMGGVWVCCVCRCLYLSLLGTIFVRRLAHWLLDWLYPLPRTIQTRCVGINGKIDTSRYAHIRHSCATSATPRLTSPPHTWPAHAIAACSCCTSKIICRRQRRKRPRPRRRHR